MMGTVERFLASLGITGIARRRELCLDGAQHAAPYGE